MKKILIFTVLFVLNSTILSAQNTYDNLGQMLRIHNYIMGKSRIKGELGFSVGQVTYKPLNKELIDYTRVTSILALDLVPNPKEHFHIRTQLFFDLIQNEDTPPYLSNMYYQIGWYDWHDQTFSFGYENYSPNKFSKTSNWGTNLKRGFVFASYNYDLLDDYSPMKFDDSSQIRITPTVRYFYEYTDKFGVDTAGNHKVVLGSSMRWSIAKKFYVEGAAYYYPNKKTIMPWDPDFTYGFGYFNWEAFRLNISYGNWIANRFPWNEKEMKNEFKNGEFKVMFTWAL